MKFLLDSVDNVSLKNCENATNLEEQGIAPLGDNSKTLKWILSYKTKPEKGGENSYAKPITKERVWSVLVHSQCPLTQDLTNSETVNVDLFILVKSRDYL